jgi:PAS domain S-box-containing protein
LAIRIFFFLLVTLVGFPAVAAEKVSLQLRWDHQFQFAGYYAAKWQGYYERAGLDVDIRSAFEPDGKFRSVLAEVAEGRADFGVAGADILKARSEGKPLVVLSSIFQRSPVAFYSRAETGVASPSDFTRLRVGTRGPDGIASVELRAMLRADGIDPARVTLRRIQGKLGIFDLANDLLDVVAGFTVSADWYAKELGLNLNVMRAVSYGVDFYGSALFTDQRWIDRDPELVHRFVAASLKGWDYALKNPREIADRISRELKRQIPIGRIVEFNRFQAKEVSRLTLYPVVQLGHTNPARWSRMHAALRGAGLIKGDFEPQRAIFDYGRYERARSRQNIDIAMLVLGVALVVGLAGWAIASRRNFRDRKQAEAAIRDSEARLRSIIDNAPFALTLKDTDGRHLAANRRFMESIGKPWSEIAGKTAEEIHSPEFGEKISAMDREVFATGGTTQHVMEIQDQFTFPGTREITKFPIIIDGGDVTGVGTISIDISARREAEEALRESERRFRDFAESTSDWLWETGPDHRFTWVSPRVESVLPHSAAHYIGKTRQELGVPDDGKDEWLRHINDLKAHRPFRNLAVSRRLPDGASSHITLSGTPVFDSGGGFLGYRGTGRNITAEVLAEQALRTNEARLKAIIDHAPYVIFLKDLDGKFILANRVFGEAMNLPPDKLLDKTTHQVMPSEFADAMAEQDAEVMRSGTASQIELPLVAPDGKSVIRNSIKFPVFDADGEIVAIGGFSIDLTEQRHREDALRQSQKMEAVGQLTGGVAHDFNNLLTVVIGNLELAQERLGDDGNIAPLLSRAREGALRGATLTHRLLAFSRKQALAPRSIDARALIDGMSDLLRRTLGETIEIEVTGDTDPWRCEADPGQLESALLNLAINARDAMLGGGGLAIETHNIDLDEHAAVRADVMPGRYVMIVVTDTGCGMVQDVLDKAFEPFYTTKEIGQGSGLGLSMVYGFVRQSNGQVTIDSEPGVGTTVKLYLPESAAVEDDAQLVGPDDAPRAGGETILVVEDDPDVRTLTVTLLSELGYEILEASDAAGALRVLDGSPRINLLFTDVVLPGGMNGPELAAEIRRRRPGMAMLFTSGYTEEAIIHQDRLEDEIELLNKPFKRSDLAQKIRAVLEHANH